MSLSSYRKTTSKSAQTTKNTTYPPCAIRCRVFLVLLISLKTACFFSWILFHQILLLFTLQIAAILHPPHTLILSVLHCCKMNPFGKEHNKYKGFSFFLTSSDPKITESEVTCFVRVSKYCVGERKVPSFKALSLLYCGLSAQRSISLLHLSAQ